MPLVWNALSSLECPYPFWNAPNLECPFGNPTGRSKFWNAPIFGMSLFSTLKSDWILAGICWNQFLECPFFENICLDTCLDILERPFFDFGMSLDILERPFSDFGMSLDIFRGIAGLDISLSRKNVFARSVGRGHVSGYNKLPLSP